MNSFREKFTTIFEAIRPESTAEDEFAIVLNAPPEISHALDDVRRRYDPAFKTGIPPHITVKRPALLLSKDKVPALHEAVRQVVHNFPPFPVQLQGYGLFKSAGRNVLFLKVQNEEPFCALHNQILDALRQIYPNGQADRYEDTNYHPHLTIGNELSEIDLAVLEYELKTGGYRLDFSFILDEISLFLHEARQPWNVLDTFKFGADLPPGNQDFAQEGTRL
ncbi:MAG TPA: 2'-5' RNA ligase family protein [Chloroflexia bacterium]|nr:2'-5' RNA ligase family protein [Chloroflexia bacterium]